ncbi:PadR family transcriptional regulator [Eubacteriaceae bacterium ES3]|nr:PadR family transcriptional regulator [Eubacteriaceae bacterium ES3]
MNISKDLMAASAIPLILSILKKQDSYGYQMIKEVKDLSGNNLEWSEGMLYPVLHRLEEKELIKSYWEKQAGKRRRKYYQITKKGLEELEEQNKQWEVIRQALKKTENWVGAMEECLCLI